MPRKQISIPGVRGTPQALAVTWDGADSRAIVAWSCLATADAGYLTAPFFLPDDADPSYPIEIYYYVRNPSAAVVPGQVIVFHSWISYTNPGETPTRIDYLDSILVPNPWPTGALVLFRMNNDAGDDQPSIPAHTLKPRALIGLRPFRESSDVGDNYAQTIQLTGNCLFDYQVRCQKCCCP